MFSLECAIIDTDEPGNHYHGVAKAWPEAQAQPPDSETKSVKLAHTGELGEQATEDFRTKSSATLTASEKFCKPSAGILRGITLRESLRRGGDLWRYKPQQLWLQRARPRVSSCSTFPECLAKGFCFLVAVWGVDAPFPGREISCEKEIHEESS